MNKQILASLMTIAIIGMVAGSGTVAYFNDTEASENNVFNAGKLDLKLDFQESYNGEQVETVELTDNPGPIFELGDVKPGDYGEATISMHVYDNPAYIWLKGTLTANDENNQTEPEALVDETTETGELAQNINSELWYDNDCDNVKDVEEVTEPVCMEIVIDRSGSMTGDKITATKNAAQSLVDQVANLDADNSSTGPHYLSIDSFNSTATVDQSLTQNVSDLKAAIDGIETGGTTSIASGINAARNELNNTELCGDKEKIMVILSNGAQNQEDALTAANNALDTVDQYFTIGVSPTTTTLEEIALLAPGGYFEVENLTGIEAAFDQVFAGLTTGEASIYNGSLAGMINAVSEGIMLDPTPIDNETNYFENSTTYCIGHKWEVPAEVGNEIQTDRVMFDFEFYTEQTRHNDNPQNPWN